MKPADKAGWYPSYCRDLYATARKGAQTRKIPWYLTPADYELVINRAGGRCEITHLAFEGGPECPAHVRRAYLPSLDRINPNGPYSLDNVRVLHSCTNTMLSDYGPEVLYRILRHLPPPQSVAWPEHTYLRAPRGQRHYSVPDPTERDEADVRDPVTGAFVDPPPYDAPPRALRAFPASAEVQVLEARLRTAEGEIKRLHQELESALKLPAGGDDPHLRELRSLGRVRELVRAQKATPPRG